MSDPTKISEPKSPSELVILADPEETYHGNRNLLEAKFRHFQILFESNPDYPIDLRITTSHIREVIKFSHGDLECLSLMTNKDIIKTAQAAIYLGTSNSFIYSVLARLLLFDADLTWVIEEWYWISSFRSGIGIYENFRSGLEHRFAIALIESFASGQDLLQFPFPKILGYFSLSMLKFLRTKFSFDIEAVEYKLIMSPYELLKLEPMTEMVILTTAIASDPDATGTWGWTGIPSEIKNQLLKFKKGCVPLQVLLK